MLSVYNDKVILYRSLWGDVPFSCFFFTERLDSTLAQQPWSWYLSLLLLHCGWLPKWGFKPKSSGQVSPLCWLVHHIYNCFKGKAMQSAISPSCSLFVNGDKGQETKEEIRHKSSQPYALYCKCMKKDVITLEVSSSVREWGQTRKGKGDCLYSPHTHTGLTKMDNFTVRNQD